MSIANTLSGPGLAGGLQGFDHRSGSLLERLLFNNRALVLAFCLIATAFFGYKALGLSLNAAFEKMIPTGHPYIVNYLENRSQLAGMGNSLRIAVEAREGDIFDAGYLDTVRKLSDELFLMPGVDRPFMKSLWAPAVRWTGVTEEGLDGGPVIPDDYDGSSDSLEQVRVNVERSGEIGQLVAANYRSSIVMVPLQDRMAETGERIDYHALSLRL
ncbi:MAG: RND transporter, partial [Betaproteobacteria bacterium HGW-Betaproteobacteria-21]